MEYASIYNYATNNLGYDAITAQQYANNTIVTNSGGGNGYQIYTVPEGQYLFGSNGKLNPNATLGYSDGTYYYTPDDWEDIIMQKALRQEYEASVSGASDVNNYYASYSYLDDGGIVSGSSFKRSAFRLRDEFGCLNAIDNQAQFVGFKGWIAEDIALVLLTVFRFHAEICL